MPPVKKEKRVDTHIYLKLDLMQAIRKAAEINDRTINAEMERTLRERYIENRA